MLRPLRLRLALAGCLLRVVCAQCTSQQVPADFVGLVKRFEQQGPGEVLLPSPVIYRSLAADGQLRFELVLAPKSLGLRPRVVPLHGRGYPISYSVLFRGRLVALFKDGRFGCYKLADLTPDRQLEQALNTRRWQRHWLLNQQLIAQRGHRYYAFDEATQTWQVYHQPVPFGARPKLYEDARYLTYADCEGEWGGTVYFFNKATRQTHRANATCATSVWYDAGHYWLLATLGHGSGSAGGAVIANPEVLPLASAPRNDRVNWQYDFTLPEAGVTPVFDFSDLLLFGGLQRQGQTLYLMYWRNTTFLVTIKGNQITIVDPLFTDKIYTHNPVTTTYGPGLALTNLDFYGLGGRDEVATLLWQGQQVIKIEWGEQPEDVK